jgi:integrase
VRAACGDDPVYIAEQLGHTDPRVTLTVYTRAVKRRAKLSGVYLAEYENALSWAALPTAERALTGTRPLPRQPSSPSYPQIWLR